MKQLPYIAGLILIILAFLFGRSCDPGTTPPRSDRDSLINVISWQLRQRKIDVVRSHKSDSIRTVTVTKWRTNIKTLTGPCDSVLNVTRNYCDTVIVKDSIALADKDRIIQGDSVVIGTQAKVIQVDSVTIVTLGKKLKREKWQKRGIIAAWILREGVRVASSITP